MAGWLQRVAAWSTAGLPHPSSRPRWKAQASWLGSRSVHSMSGVVAFAVSLSCCCLGSCADHQQNFAVPLQALSLTMPDLRDAAA